MEQSSSMQDFHIPNRFAPDEALERWRKAALVLNASRRFRYTADLKHRRKTKERNRFKIGGLAAQAALRFIDAVHHKRYVNSGGHDKVEKHGFELFPSVLAAMVEGQDFELYSANGGLNGISEKLKTSLERGISGEESDLQIRKEAYGSNTYTEKPVTGFWKFVWEAMHDLTLMILLLCAVISVPIGISTTGWKDGWYDGVGIFLSIFVVVLVTASSDYQQSLQFQDLDKEKKKIFVLVTRYSKRQKVSIFDLVVGDIVHLAIGDQVPADGLFVSGYSLTIDASGLTGESQNLHASAASPFLLSGSKVVDGTGVMLITGVGMNTEWGHLMSSLSEGGESETPLQVKLNGLATLIGKVGLWFAALTFIVLTGRFLIAKESLAHWNWDDLLVILNYFAMAVTIIVVAVPEGLPLAVTLTLAYAMKKMMKEKALVRHLAACETMGSATTICTDKTGTLTTNRMTAVKAWIAGKEHKVSETKWELSGKLCEHLLEGVFWNTNGDIAERINPGIEPLVSGSPTEAACLKFGMALGGEFNKVRSKAVIVKVEPFNSTRKKMGVMVRAEDGSLHAYWKGAPEIILAMCDKTISANSDVIPIDQHLAAELQDVIKRFADQSLRTLCLAHQIMEPMADNYDSDFEIPDEGFICAAILGIKDPLRKGVSDAVRRCYSAGIKVMMVTGDNVHTAIAIARECGILIDGDVAEGPDFRKWTAAEKKRRVPNLQVLARSSPSDKLSLVKELRELGEVVAVTGDGSNDAPALYQSDIGLAMGISGTEVAKDSADIVILDDNFSTIVNVAKWGRNVYINIQKFLQFQLTVNLVALVINFSSACITGAAPLTAVQLLWVNLIMDTLGALALTTERPREDLMERPPVRRTSAFITSIMWRNVFGQAAYQLVVLVIMQYKGKSLLHLHGTNVDELLNTMIFNTFVFCQVFNELNSREMEKINIFNNILDNWVFWMVVSSTVIFQILMVEVLGEFADTVPLNWKQWALTILIGSFSLPVAVVVKLIPVTFFEYTNTTDSTSTQKESGYSLLPSVPCEDED